MSITQTWTNAGGGTFADAGNWSPQGTPGPLDHGTVTSTGATLLIDPTGTVRIATQPRASAAAS